MTPKSIRDAKRFHAGAAAAVLIFALLLTVGGIAALIATDDTPRFAPEQFEMALRDRSNAGEYAMNVNQWFLWRLRLREEPPPAYGSHRIQTQISCSWSKVERDPSDK